MTAVEIFNQFLVDIQTTKWYEYVAVFAGIVSVWLSRMENIWVYPIGLINTIIYIYISFSGHLLGEATVNLYYTLMSFIGWYNWLKKDTQNIPVLHIRFSTSKEWIHQLVFFGSFYSALYFGLHYFKQSFFPGAIPWADAFASASAFTGMWLMTRKKVESWMWWILTNIASIPLYFVKHYVLTSVYYIVLLLMAISGLVEWTRRAKTTTHAA